MATIGTLVVNLIARTSVFDKKMRTSRGGLRAFQLQAAQSRKQLLAFTKAAVAIAAAGYAIVKLSKKFADFEKQMAMVSTMLDQQSMRIMPEYARQLKNLAIEFGEGTETLSKGLYDILSASIAPAKAMDVLAVSVEAAKAGITDTAIAADAITTILNSYGLSADMAGVVSDKLFAIVKRGKLTFMELAPNIGKVASLANTAGLSFDELGAAIATMTRAGLQADLATTSLRSIITQFLKPTDEAKKAAAAFGLELSSTTLRAMGLTGVLLKLREASAEQLAAILPNVRGLAGFAAALKQVDKQIGDLDLMLHSAGLTQEAYEKMTDNLTHSYDRLIQVVKIAAVEFGEGLAPGMMETSEAMIQLVGNNRELIKGFSETAAIGDKVYEGLKFILKIGGYLASGLVTIRAAVTELSAGFLGLSATAVSSFAKIAEALDNLQNVYADTWLGKKLGVEKATRHLELEAWADAFAAEASALQEKAKGMMLDLPSIHINKMIEEFEALRGKLQGTSDDMRTMGETAIDAQGGAAKVLNVMSAAAAKAEKRVQFLTAAIDKELEMIGRLNESRERSRDLVELQIAAEEAYGKASEKTIQVLAEYEDKLRQLQLAQMANEIGEAFARSFEDVVLHIRTVQEALRALAQDLARLLMRRLITQPLAAAIGASLGSMFADTSASGSTGKEGYSLSTSVAHSGGLIEQITARRKVPALAFAGAPRLHSGFAPDEFPAILQRGETVIPRGGAMPGIIVNINNRTSSPMEAGRKDVKFDGEKFVIDVVVNDYHAGGQIRNLVKGQE